MFCCPLTVSQRLSPPLPTTLLALHGLKLPPELTQKLSSPPNPPDPPDNFSASLVVALPSHLNLAATLAVNSLGCQICSLFSWQPPLSWFPLPIIMTSEGMVFVTLLLVVQWSRICLLLVLNSLSMRFHQFQLPQHEDVRLIKFDRSLAIMDVLSLKGRHICRHSLEIIVSSFGVNLYGSCYLSDHFDGDSEFPCNRMSIVGKSLVFVRSLTAICSLFPDFVSVNLVDFSCKSLMVSLALIYLRDLVNCLECLCLGFRCLSYSFMEMSLLSISPLWETCLVAGTISFFGDAILSPKDMRFEDLQSHLVSKKPSLRRCSESAFVVVGFFFPKFPLVSGLDDQDLSVLQGFSFRLIVPSTLVVEFVAFWVAMDAINQEDVEIILVCGSLMFSFYDLYLIYHSFNHPLVVFLALVVLLLCFSFVLVVIPPLFIEIETF